MAQQIGIERAHQMELFANSRGLRLTPREEELIRQCATRIVRTRYQGNSAEEQRRMSRLATGMLPTFVLNQFRRRVRKQSELRFCLLSAHDNTLMALLSHLGCGEWPIPQFGAFICFELHRDHSTGRHFVRALYNPDPSTYMLPECKKGELKRWFRQRCKKHARYGLQTPFVLAHHPAPAERSARAVGCDLLASGKLLLLRASRHSGSPSATLN